MRYFTSWLLVLLATALCYTSVPAQTPVNACQTDLIVAHERARGKLARVGNALVFLDEPGLNHSFTIDRGNIASAHEYAGVFSVYTRNWVRYHNVWEKHFTFQFFTNNCYAIAAWLNRPLPPPPYPSPYARRIRRPFVEGSGGGRILYPCAGPRLARRVLRAEQERSFSRNIKGSLSISERMIQFVPEARDRQTHRWDLKDIREIEQEGRDKLKVTPFGESAYTFKLQGVGLSPAAFRALDTRIRKGC